MRNLFAPIIIVLSLSMLFSQEKKDSYLSYYYFLLSSQEIFEGNWERADKLLQESLKYSEEPSAIYYYISEVKAHLDMLEESEKYAMRSIELDSNNCDAYVLLAKINLSYISSNEKENEKYFRKAKDFLKESLKCNPSNVESLFLLGNVSINLGEIPEAKESLKKLIEISPFSIEGYLSLADVYIREKKYDEAEKLLLKTLDINPYYYRAFSVLGDLYELQKNFDKAENLYSRAVQIYKSDLNFEKRLIKILIRKSKYGEALKEIEQARKREKIDKELLILKAQILKQIKKLEQAKDVYQEILNLYPGDWVPRYYLSELNLDTYYYQEALNVFLSLKDDETIPHGLKITILKEIGYIYIIMKDHDNAEKYFQEVRKINERDLQANSYIAYIKKGKKNYEDALKIVDEFLKEVPDDKFLFITKIEILKAVNKRNEALQLVKEKIKEYNHLEYYSTGALIYNKQKDWEKGLKFFKRAEKEFPMKDELFLRWGAYYEENNRISESEKYFRRCLRINPKNSSALNYLSYMWAERGLNLKEALEMSKKAVNIDPENPDYIDTLGWVYFKMKDYEKAKDYLEKAYRKKNWEPEIIEHLGDLYFSLKEYDLALEFWKKAADYNPKNKKELYNKIKNVTKIKKEGNK
ncbi:MAG: tetratricopeptide repeat protein [Acidobacteriota bacterium]